MVSLRTKLTKWVGLLLGRDHGDFDGLGDGEEAGGPHGFQADARMRVGGQLAQQVERFGDVVAAVAQDAGGRGPGPEIRRGQHLLEQRHVDAVVVLVQPQRFQEQMLIFGIALVQCAEPFLGGGDDLVAVAGGQLGADAVADAVLGLTGASRAVWRSARRRS